MIQKVNYQEWSKKHRFSLKNVQIANFHDDYYDVKMTGVEKMREIYIRDRERSRIVLA